MPQKGLSKLPYSDEKDIILLGKMLNNIYDPAAKAWLISERLKYKANDNPRNNIQNIIDLDLNDFSQNHELGETIWIKKFNLKSGQFKQLNEVCDASSDLVPHLRIWKIQIDSTLNLLEKIHSQLFSNQFISMELINFSNYKTYPYQYSFERAIDLIHSLESNFPDAIEFADHLSRIGFEIVDQAYTRPAFLLKPQKEFISTFLNYLKPAISEGSITAQSEIESLLPTLRQHEMKDETLISRSGVHLFILKKKFENNAK